MLVLSQRIPCLQNILSILGVWDDVKIIELGLDPTNQKETRQKEQKFGGELLYKEK